MSELSANTLTAKRSQVLEALCATLPGKNLYELAEEYSIKPFLGDKLNKGWVGQTIERAGSLTNNNFAGPDGFDFELKSTRLLPRAGGWVPKETIKITQLNPKSILEETFETSALWHKLSRLIVVGYHLRSPHDCVTVQITGVNINDPKLIEPIRRFWEDVQNAVCTGEITEHYNLGSSRDLVQLRPTGDGQSWSTCPTTGEKFPARAFYATKILVSQIFANRC